MSGRDAAAFALALALCAPSIHAAESRQQVDEELLEFLGSLDAEDEEWRDYLAERPVRPATEEDPVQKPDAKPRPVSSTSRKPVAQQEQVKKP
jgi:hypothetical protein